MSARKVDSQIRKDRVLAIVVDQYTRNVTPVSSKFIVKKYFYDLSPATVRNILAELEEEGHLTHPHTSAGRVPTQKGYRYFVDHLMNELKLLEEEKKRIQKGYMVQVAELQTLLRKASEAISDLTHYTSFVSVDGENDLLYYGLSYVVGYPEFQDFTRIRLLLKMLEEKEQILEIINRTLKNKIEFLIGQEINCKDMKDCSLAISRYKRKDGASGRIALLGPTRMDYERVVSALEYLSEIMSQL